MRKPNQPAIVATLDLSDGNQAALQDLIRRTHTGRWRSYRALKMRQDTGGITELAETVPRRRAEVRRFVVLHWTAAPLGLSWLEPDSFADALRTYDRADLRKSVLPSPRKRGMKAALRGKCHAQNKATQQQRGRA